MGPFFDASSGDTRLWGWWRFRRSIGFYVPARRSIAGIDGGVPCQVVFARRSDIDLHVK